MTPLLDPCPKVRARQAFDKKRGMTTSDGEVEFIRRTCPCEGCVKRRVPK